MTILKWTRHRLTLWNMRKSYLLVSAQFLLMGLVTFSGPLGIAGYFPWLPIAAGVFMGSWAVMIMQRGRFNIIPDVPPQASLVTKGPYRFIRHPMYSSLLLILLGLLLGSFSWLRLIFGLFLASLVWIKLSFEEFLLCQHFPEYRQYQQRTTRLIPFIL